MDRRSVDPDGVVAACCFVLTVLAVLWVWFM
jgi:preprotein translocase subunit Sec61beta